MAFRIGSSKKHDKHQTQKIEEQPELPPPPDPEPETEEDIEEETAWLFSDVGEGEYFPPRPLEDFVETMKQWAEADERQKEVTDARHYTVTAANALLHYMQGSQIADASCCSYIVGDQSSGKSTLCNSLTKQIVLYVNPRIGTKARTFVRLRHNPSVQSYVSRFVYRHIRMAELNPDQLTTVYENQFKDTEIDPRNLCEITIDTPQPIMSLNIVDHPGWNRLQQSKATEAFETSWRQLDGFRQPGNNLLLCHAVGEDTQKDTYILFSQRWNQVPDGHLYVAVTKMDKLDGQYLESCLAQHQEHFQYGRDEDGFHVTTTDLLDVLERDIIYGGDSGTSSVLPTHSKVYFVASCGESFEDMNIPCDQRLAKFQNSEQTNEQLMWRSLTDPDYWAGTRIILKPSPTTEFEHRVGVGHLFRALLRSQFSGILRVTTPLVQRIIPDTLHKLHARRSEIKRALLQCPDVHDLLPRFLSCFVSLFLSLSSNQPFVRSGSLDKNKDEVWDQIYQKFRDQEKELGYDLHDEHTAYYSLPDTAQFPPRGMRCADFEQRLERLLPRVVRGSEAKEYSISRLLRRLQQEYVCLSNCIDIPHVAPAQILRNRRAPPGTPGGDVSESVASHVVSELQSLYLSSRHAGNKFIAQRTAMSFIMHAQSVLSVLSSVPLFAPLLLAEVSRPADEAEGSVTGAASAQQLGFVEERENQQNTKSYEPVNILKVVGAASRHLNSGHPANPSSQKDRPPELEIDSTGVVEVLKKCITCWDRTRAETGLPCEDLVHVLIAQFYDTIFATMESKLDHVTQSLAHTQSSYSPAFQHWAPLFLHQDPAFIRQYLQRHPSLAYSQQLLAPAFFRPEDGTRVANPSSIQMELCGLVDGEPIGEPMPLQMQHYEDESTAPFRELNPTIVEFSAAVHQLQELNVEDRATFMADLLCAGETPDIPGRLESELQAHGFEGSSINYVVQRYVSAGILHSLQAGLRQINSIAYPFSQTDCRTELQEDLFGRYCSLLLGYDYAYATQDRPSAQANLDPLHVIPFMYRNADTLGEFHAKFEMSSSGFHVTDIEADMYLSPLLRRILQLKREERRETIRRLHGLYVCVIRYNDTNARHALSDALITLLLPHRFQGKLMKEYYESQYLKVEASLKKWEEIMTFVDAYQTFVTQHGEALVGTDSLTEESKRLTPNFAHSQPRVSSSGAVSGRARTALPRIFA